MIIKLLEGLKKSNKNHIYLGMFVKYVITKSDVAGSYPERKPCSLSIMMEFMADTKDSNNLLKSNHMDR